ncbi:hypothetical protein QBC47DRAFT_459325 [Echria macrotheca]|uniref:Uncharacterized protein n=1 Tax=Echria macrotheca TaxID=438768 RepID=A0AAJ0BGL6_9PEZI|nr:hypothetical protein QBC47DRAFT_459325 [Echria macrotheca]
MHSNSQRGFVNSLHLDTDLYQTPVTEPGMDFTGTTIESYSSVGHPYPSGLSYADIPTSAPGSSWAYDGLSAHSEPALSSAGWMSSYRTAMPISAGDASRLVGGVYGWDALQSYPNNYPATDDSETVSSNPFSTDGAMLDVSSTTTQTTTYGMDYASQSSGSSTAGPPTFLTTPPPTLAYNTPSASSPPGGRRIPQRVKSNPRMRVKREPASSSASSSSSSSRKRKQESKQKQTQSQSLYPGDLPMAEQTLIARYANRIPSSAVARMTPEHIRREAWRICEAEAREMSERRVMLLEHEGGALERETAKLQISVSAMREAVAREQRELERAVEMAERLSSSC